MQVCAVVAELAGQQRDRRTQALAAAAEHVAEHLRERREVFDVLDAVERILDEAQIVLHRPVDRCATFMRRPDRRLDCDPGPSHHWSASAVSVGLLAVVDLGGVSSRMRCELCIRYIADVDALQQRDGRRRLSHIRRLVALATIALRRTVRAVRLEHEVLERNLSDDIMQEAGLRMRHADVWTEITNPRSMYRRASAGIRAEVVHDAERATVWQTAAHLRRPLS